MNFVPTDFGNWGEEQLTALRPAHFRFQEVFYFYERFRLSCGMRPLRLSDDAGESQFEWIANADAFLMMLISVEELLPSVRKKELEQLPLYSFLKQLRNLTVHSVVLPARRHGRRAAPPIVTRIYNRGIGTGTPDSVDPKINVDRMRKVLRQLVRSRTRHKHHISGARTYLREQVVAGRTYVVLREVFEQGLEAFGKAAGVKRAPT